MNKIKRRIKTLERKIKNNSEKINKLRTKNKGLKGKTSKKDITIKRRIEKRKRLHEENKKYREELKEKRKELKELETINERISNIYDTDTTKSTIRRFRTIYHQKDQLNDNTQKFLKNLGKNFNKTIEYFKNPQIP